VAADRDGQVRRYDAVVVGASMSGLASAAILANRGYRVAVVETLQRPGGRTGGTQHEGYWIDWGQRDGHGIADLAFAPIFMRRAAEAAGVQIHLEPFVGRCVRVHWLPEGTATELPAELVLAGPDADPMERMRALCRFFGGVGDDELETVAKESLEVLTRLAMMDDEEAWSLVPVRMGDWLARNVSNPTVRRVMMQQFECIPFTPAVETSVGRYVFFLKTVSGEPAMANDPEAGGVEGLIRPWVRGIESRGGEIWTGWKPIEILTEDGRARGVVAVDEHQFVQVFEAPVVVSSYPGWRLPELVDERLLSPTFTQGARAVERYAAEILCWWAGLHRLPTIRSDGRVEDFSAPWQRIVYGTGAVHEAHGGFLYPSRYSQRSAPPGKHLLVVWLAAPGEDEGRRWRHWAEAKSAMDMNLTYLRDVYFADLDDCVEWSRYQWCAPPSWLSWYLKPIYRHPIKVSTIEGLYVASSSAEGLGSWCDSECAVALDTCELIASDRAVR
jgi:phytoene dehydrogenase-like protein